MFEIPAPLIEPTPVLELGRQPTNPRFLLIGFAVTAFLHIYAIILLPAVLDIEFDGDQEVNLAHEEIGNDSDWVTNYNVDRIEELSLRGSGPAPLEMPEEARPEDPRQTPGKDQLRRADDFSETIWVPSAEPLGWYGKRSPWPGPPYQIGNYGRERADHGDGRRERGRAKDTVWVLSSEPPFGFSDEDTMWVPSGSPFGSDNDGGQALLLRRMTAGLWD